MKRRFCNLFLFGIKVELLEFSLPNFVKLADFHDMVKSKLLLKFPHFLRSKVLNCWSIREPTRTFSFWWKFCSFPLFHGYLTSSQKSHPSPINFRETFALNLIKQNVTHFSVISHKPFFLCPWKNLKFKFLLPDTVSFSTSYQRWLIKQKLLISAPLPRLCLFLSLVVSRTKQPHSKVDNSMMYRKCSFNFKCLLEI